MTVQESCRQGRLPVSRRSVNAGTRLEQALDLFHIPLVRDVEVLIEMLGCSADQHVGPVDDPHIVVHEDLAEVLGTHRAVAITRELTKLHEEVWRGNLERAAVEFDGRPSIKGEITIVIGPKPVAAADLNAAAADARIAIDRGATPSEAVREAAAAHGVSRRLLYQEVIARPGS